MTKIPSRRFQRVALIHRLYQLLREARRLSNLTVKDVNEVRRWHESVDDALAKLPGDDRSERWDAPHRVKYRQRVKEMFR